MSRKWKWENMKHDQRIANLVFVVHRAPREQREMGRKDGEKNALFKDTQSTGRAGTRM